MAAWESGETPELYQGTVRRSALQNATGEKAGKAKRREEAKPGYEAPPKSPGVYPRATKGRIPPGIRFFYSVFENSIAAPGTDTAAPRTGAAANTWLKKSAGNPLGGGRTRMRRPLTGLVINTLFQTDTREVMPMI